MEKGLIKKVQGQIKDRIKEKGFDDETWEETLLILVEECGEVIQACRRNMGIGHTKHQGEKSEIADELSDLLFMTYSLAIVLKIDLEKAFWDKQKKLDSRNYSRIRKKK